MYICSLYIQNKSINWNIYYIEYTEIGTNEELPLGEEFQSMVKCFFEPHEKNITKKYALAKKLLHQLEWVQHK
jgi:hypothetical protein